MPDCREVRLIDRLATVLAGINATGSYTYTFAATDAVVYGDPPDSPIVDAGQIYYVWAGETNEHGIALTDYQPTVTFEIHVYVPAADITPLAKSKAILNAFADITIALELDQNVDHAEALGRIAQKIVIRNKTEIVFGSDWESPPMAAWGTCTLEIWWRRRNGVAT